MSAITTLGVDQGVAPEPQAGADGRLSTAYAFHMSNDPNILFEEYLYYAKLTRAEEKTQERASPNQRTFLGTLTSCFKIKNPPQGVDGPIHFVSDEKEEWNATVQAQPFDAFNNLVYSHPSEVSDAEWRALSRGIRTVGWITCFYLITSDIIGPFVIPWVSQTSNSTRDSLTMS